VRGAEQTKPRADGKLAEEDHFLSIGIFSDDKDGLGI
jgi:hypothetical protein